MNLRRRIQDSLFNRARQFVRRKQTVDLAQELGVHGSAAADLETLQTLASVKAVLLKPVDIIVDVGAHTGRFVAPAMQVLGARKALCFEPNTKLHPELQAALRGLDADVRGCALSGKSGSLEFHVHADSEMSSLLPADKEVMKREFSFDDTSQMNDVRVRVSTLDEELAGVVQPNQCFFLKIDTQGNELSVLRGAGKSLRGCDGVLLEHMFTTPYVGQASFAETVSAMDTLGFRCAGALHILRRPSWRISGVDFLFLRVESRRF